MTMYKKNVLIIFFLLIGNRFYGMNSRNTCQECTELTKQNTYLATQNASHKKDNEFLFEKNTVLTEKVKKLSQQLNVKKENSDDQNTKKTDSSYCERCLEYAIKTSDLEAHLKELKITNATLEKENKERFEVEEENRNFKKKSVDILKNPSKENGFYLLERKNFDLSNTVDILKTTIKDKEKQIKKLKEITSKVVNSIDNDENSDQFDKKIENIVADDTEIKHNDSRKDTYIKKILSENQRQKSELEEKIKQLENQKTILDNQQKQQEETEREQQLQHKTKIQELQSKTNELTNELNEACQKKIDLELKIKTLELLNKNHEDKQTELKKEYEIKIQELQSKTNELTNELSEAHRKKTEQTVLEHSCFYDEFLEQDDNVNIEIEKKETLGNSLFDDMRNDEIERLQKQKNELENTKKSLEEQLEKVKKEKEDINNKYEELNACFVKKGALNTKELRNSQEELRNAQKENKKLGKKFKELSEEINEQKDGCATNQIKLLGLKLKNVEMYLTITQWTSTIFFCLLCYIWYINRATIKFS